MHIVRNVVFNLEEPELVQHRYLAIATCGSQTTGRITILFRRSHLCITYRTRRPWKILISSAILNGLDERLPFKSPMGHQCRFSAFLGLCSNFDNNSFENCKFDPQFSMGSPSWVDTQLCYDLRDTLSYRNSDLIKLLVTHFVDIAINFLVYSTSQVAQHVFFSNFVPSEDWGGAATRYLHIKIHLTVDTRQSLGGSYLLKHSKAFHSSQPAAGEIVNACTAY